MLADQVMPKAEALARKIAANGPIAVRKAKETVLQNLSVSFEEGFRIERENADFTMATEDDREGPRAFLEKRLPQYRGREQLLLRRGAGAWIVASEHLRSSTSRKLTHSRTSSHITWLMLSLRNR